MCNVTKMDRIRNAIIRGATRMGDIPKKVQERRSHWYGHAMKRDEEYVEKRAIRMGVEGRRKGRPKPRWIMDGQWKC